jgi:hypothetical protein
MSSSLSPVLCSLTLSSSLTKAVFIYKMSLGSPEDTVTLKRATDTHLLQEQHFTASIINITLYITTDSSNSAMKRCLLQ